MSHKIGIALNVTNDLKIEEGPAITMEHPVLGLINLARLKKTALQTEYNGSELEIPWHEVDYIARSYDEYKKTHRLLDYTDMLSMFAQEAPRICPQFDFCFLDEAQDLSPLQWDIAHVLDRKSTKMYVAGDDDQAIYRWSGADVEYFQSLDSGSEVLEQSYRIPRRVHDIAQRIVSRIHRRFPKVYKPTPQEGKVQRLASIQELDMSEGSWLIMAQANYMLSPLASDLKSFGYLFERNGSRSVSEKMSTAINGWEQLRKGNHVSLPTVQAIYSYMAGNGIRIERGKKKIVADTDATFTLSELQSDYGLLATTEMIWHEALDKLPAIDREYITGFVAARGEVQCQTAHSFIHDSSNQRRRSRFGGGVSRSNCCRSEGCLR